MVILYAGWDFVQSLRISAVPRIFFSKFNVLKYGLFHPMPRIPCGSSPVIAIQVGDRVSFFPLISYIGRDFVRAYEHLQYQEKFQFFFSKFNVLK